LAIILSGYMIRRQIKKLDERITNKKIAGS
jgi:hypothetical protein